MKLLVLTPVFNDWESLARLSEEICAQIAGTDLEVSALVAINDASPQPHGPAFALALPCQVVNLAVNVGHQRAIAIGMAHLLAHHRADLVVVMDSDGEDLPRYLPELCRLSAQSGQLVFAERRKRSESLAFRAGYALYKLAFRLLTNHSVSFGNFSCLPFALLGRMVRNPHLWNNYPGAVLRSKLPFRTLPTERGKRYFGQSKMNLQSLIIHGLSAMAVHMEIVAFKVFMLSLMGFGLLFGYALVVLYMKYISHAAIPGWTSNVLLALLNTAGVLFVVTLLLFFMQLSQRNQAPPYLMAFYQQYIESIEDHPAAPR